MKSTVQSKVKVFNNDWDGHACHSNTNDIYQTVHQNFLIAYYFAWTTLKRKNTLPLVYYPLIQDSSEMFTIVNYKDCLRRHQANKDKI